MALLWQTSTFGKEIDSTQLPNHFFSLIQTLLISNKNGFSIIYILSMNLNRDFKGIFEKKHASSLALNNLIKLGYSMLEVIVLWMEILNFLTIFIKILKWE